MILGKTIGRISGIQKNETLRGLVLSIVQPIGPDQKPVGSILVAVDPLGVGMGQTVLVLTGSPAVTVLQKQRIDAVTDATIVSIVDHIEIK